jgi:hypothetical protein
MERRVATGINKQWCGRSRAKLQTAKKGLVACLSNSTRWIEDVALPSGTGTTVLSTRIAGHLMTSWGGMLEGEKTKRIEDPKRGSDCCLVVYIEHNKVNTGDQAQIEQVGPHLVLHAPEALLDARGTDNQFTAPKAQEKNPFSSLSSFWLVFAVLTLSTRYSRPFQSNCRFPFLSSLIHFFYFFPLSSFIGLTSGSLQRARNTAMVAHQEHLDSGRRAGHGAHAEEMSSFVGQNSSDSNAPAAYSHKKRVLDRTTNPSLWNTKEFYFYYFVFITCIPYMFKTAHDASSGKCSFDPDPAHREKNNNRQNLI